MKMLFKLREFIITKPKTISLEIADKLYWYHIIPMIPVREKMKVWLTASLHSGYRPKWWERNKGRSGNSQHTFGQIDVNTFDQDGKGAVDWTCNDFERNKDKLLRLIIEETEYTRMAVYNSFIHCDHKKTASGKREVHSSDSKSNWTFIKFV